MKKKLTVALFTIISIASFAQSIINNSSINQQLYSTFESLRLDSVSTGYLLDRALDIVDLRSFSGSTLTDNNYADFGKFRNSFLTINSAKVNSHGISYDVDSIVNSFTDTVAVELGAALFQYNYIVDNAITDNLLLLQNNKLYDVIENGLWKNPYSSSYSFIVAAALPAREGTQINYTFSSNHYYGVEQPRKIEVSFDGSYNTMHFPLDTTVTYLSTGVKEIKVRITLNSNQVLEGHTAVRLLEPQQSTSGQNTSPDGIVPFSITSSYGDNVSAVVSYKCSPIHGGGQIIKPLVFVEGFDDPFLGSLQTVFSSLINNTDRDNLLRLISGTAKGYLDFTWGYDSVLGGAYQILAKYDIIYVDWNNPRVDIRSSAELLIHILNWINSQKHNNGSIEKNIIVGHSMGGLVARYALRKMEIATEPIPHETAYFVSYDSPHLGANVTIGAQFAVRYAHRVLYGENGNSGILTSHLFDGLVEEIIGLMDSPAAKQMMYYYVNEYYGCNGNYHSIWQQELDSLGFPKGDAGSMIENLAIVNGGIIPAITNQPLARLRIQNGNSKLAFQNLAFIGLTNLYNIDADFKVFHNLGSDQPVADCEVKYKKFWPWLLNGTQNEDYVVLLSESANAPVGSPALDSLRSSTLSLSATVLPNANDTISLFVKDSISFIPVKSALAIYNSSNVGGAPAPLTETPFCAYYLNQNAQNHMTSYSAYWDWLYEQTQFSMAGPDDFALTGDVFSISGTPPVCGTPVWSVSNQNCASINNGVLSVVTPSVQVIDYCQTNGQKFYRKQKTVLAGFPSVTLWKSYSQSDSILVHASCNNTQLTSVLDTLLSKNILSCRWVLTKMNGDTVVVSNQKRELYVNNSQNEYLSVRFRLYDAINYANDNTRISAANSILLTDPDVYFAHDPQAVYIGPYLMYFDYQTINEPVIPTPPDNPIYHIRPYILSHYFTIWHNPSFSNIPDPDRITVGNEPVELTEVIQETINGIERDVFCFNITNTSTFQNTVSDIRQGLPDALGVFMKINVFCGQDKVQSIYLPILPEENNILPDL